MAADPPPPQETLRPRPQPAPQHKPAPALPHRLRSTVAVAPPTHRGDAPTPATRRAGPHRRARHRIPAPSSPATPRPDTPATPACPDRPTADRRATPHSAAPANHLEQLQDRLTEHDHRVHNTRARSQPGRPSRQNPRQHRPKRREPIVSRQIRWRNTHQRLRQRAKSTTARHGMTLHHHRAGRPCPGSHLAQAAATSASTTSTTPPGPDRHKPTKAPSSLARPTKAARPGNARTSEVWPRIHSHGLARDHDAHLVVAAMAHRHR